MALVDFKNVNKYYGDYHALRNINLEFEPGQVVVLLGPSGSGKSTLIRTIIGLEAIDEGQLVVNGHDISSTSIKELVALRKEVGMVFQHFNLYPHKTVLENVTLAPTKVLGIDKATAEKTAQKYLEFVNLWDRKDSYPAMLSGGQKQRVSIARAVLKNPPIMIHDEATSALDTESERYVQDALEKMMENRTSLVIAHRLSTIQKADHIVVMEKGDIIEQGSHQELMEKNGTYRKLVELQNFD